MIFIVSTYFKESEAERVTFTPNFKNPAQYAKAKIQILVRDFCLNLSEEDEAHILSLNTRDAIDAAALGMINKYWN